MGRPHVGGISFGGALALELYRHHLPVPATLVLASAYAGWQVRFQPRPSTNACSSSCGKPTCHPSSGCPGGFRACSQTRPRPSWWRRWWGSCRSSIPPGPRRWPTRWPRLTCEHHAAAIDHYFGPGLREEVAEHYRQLLTGFPDLQVKVEDDLIAEADKVVARLTLMGTHKGTFAGRPGTGQLASWSSIRIYRVADGKVVQTWAMQDRLSLLQQLGAMPALEPVNWAGGEPAGTSQN